MKSSGLYNACMNGDRSNVLGLVLKRQYDYTITFV